VQAPGGFDQIAALLQALQQRQIPPLPGGTPQPVVAAAPPPQTDTLGLLRIILTNPHLQQALQSMPPGVATPPPVQLPMPAVTAPGHVRPQQIPMAAVLNALVALSGRAMTELNENASEAEPEIPAYLVGDDGDFLVDPASADDRAALVTHLFVLSDAAQHAGWYPQLEGAPDEADVELDESEEWARDAGIR
jgi:hypothetical protein